MYLTNMHQSGLATNRNPQPMAQVGSQTLGHSVRKPFPVTALSCSDGLCSRRTVTSEGHHFVANTHPQQQKGTWHEEDLHLFQSGHNSDIAVCHSQPISTVWYHGSFNHIVLQRSQTCSTVAHYFAFQVSDLSYYATICYFLPGVSESV